MKSRTFERFAEDYELGRPRYPEFFVEDILKRASLGPNGVVLDVAGGTGRCGFEFARRGFQVYVVEPSAAMRGVGMQKAREQRLSVRYVASTADPIAVAPHSIDLAIVGMAFHFLHVQRAPQELARVVRPGGILVGCWYFRDNAALPWMEGLDRIVRRYVPSNISDSRWHPRIPEETWRSFSLVEDQDRGYSETFSVDRAVKLVRSFSQVQALPESARCSLESDLEGLLHRRVGTSFEMPLRLRLIMMQRR